MKNYSFNDSYDLYKALRDASPAERENIVKQANLDLQDDYGWTALMLATCNCREDIVQSLIKAGANKDIKDNDDWTALMHAIDKDVLDLLSTPHQLIKDFKQKLSESEQKNAKLEAQIARNKFLDKKRKQQQLRNVLLGKCITK